MIDVYEAGYHDALKEVYYVCILKMYGKRNTVIFFGASNSGKSKLLKRIGKVLISENFIEGKSHFRVNMAMSLEAACLQYEPQIIIANEFNLERAC